MFWALLALTLYALLPIMRNTCTGLAEVPAGLTMAGTALGAIGEKAVDCLRLLPKLVPEKDKDFGEKLCRKAFVWWSVALQRGNSMVQLNGVYRGNVANRQELGQDQLRRRPDR